MFVQLAMTLCYHALNTRVQTEILLFDFLIYISIFMTFLLGHRHLKIYFVACEHETLRPACTSSQSNKRFYNSFSVNYHATFDVCKNSVF